MSVNLASLLGGIILLQWPRAESSHRPNRNRLTTERVGSTLVSTHVPDRRMDLLVPSLPMTEQFVTIALQVDDWQHVEPKLAAESDLLTRVNIARHRFQNDRTRRVCILVHDKDVVGLCLARYLSRSGDVDTMAGIEHLRPLHPAVRVGRFVRDVRPNLKVAVEQALREGRSLDPLESNEIEAILRSDVLNAATLDFLIERLSLTPDMSTHVARIQGEQRDALAMTLEVAGISSKEVLRASDQRAEDGRLSNMPYTFGIESERAGEVAVIQHDSGVLDGWEKLTNTDGRFDTVTFADPKSGKQKITVQYADRRPLEQVTGTDLIYSRSGQPGYTMVQYKQMTRERSEDVYRVDDQLRDEIKRMREISPTTTEWLSTAYDYRLSTEAFYMKLVASDVKRPSGNKLADGMYFPLGMFELMLTDPEFRGPRGGEKITSRDAPKHLGNDLFVELLRGGWIGTVGAGTTSLQGTIDQRLRDLVEHRLDRGRSVLIAENHAISKAMTRSTLF